MGKVAEAMTLILEALESMVWQFAYRGVKGRKLMIWTGGLSALEEAFEAIGWKDPHILSATEAQDVICEIKRCVEWSVSGGPWYDGGPYLHLCSEHHQAIKKELPQPTIKGFALRREATRCRIHRQLPPCYGCKTVEEEPKP